MNSPSVQRGIGFQLASHCGEREECGAFEVNEWNEPVSSTHYTFKR